MSRWLVTAHRDWQRLDIFQFEVEAPTREEAIELARKGVDSPNRAGTWIKGDPRLRDSGLIVTPRETPWT
jgi:hypothetical protein